MSIGHHFEFTFGALRRWFVAQCCDAAIVALLWLVALQILHVPLAPFWALLGCLFQFVPHFGPVLTLLGPAMALLISEAPWERWTGLLIAYAVIAVADGLILQPYLMRRQNRVPIWASILAPVALGFLIPFWGVLLAPPLLAVIYAYARRRQEQQKVVRSGKAIVLPPEHAAPRPRPRATPFVDTVETQDSTEPRRRSRH
jgi:predicted PurR-regulated permease PerM